MKEFFDDFDWELAIGTALFFFAVAFSIIGVILAIACASVWPFLLWVPAILFAAVIVGKGWWE